MEASSSKKEKESVIFFPFMAQGHITPFLALALQLGAIYDIVFVSTPLNIKKLTTPLLSSFTSIRLLQIPFNSSDHGLPPDSEDADTLPYNLVLQLLEASSSCLESPFRKLLADVIEQNQGVKPLCVIADFFFGGWSAKVAHEFGVFHAIFSGSGGYGLACYYSMWLHLPHRHTQQQDTSGVVEFMLPDFTEAGNFHITQLSASFLVADGNDPYSIFQRKNLPTWSDSDALLFNSVEEVDKIGLNYFRRKLGLPVWAIGPIMLSKHDRPPPPPQNNNSNSNIPQLCVEWLDSKEENSVLYVSFGSQNAISASQMMKLAKALDVSHRNFIWVVRPPLGFDVNDDSATGFKAEEWLPEGYVHQIESEKRGLVIEKWGPQVEILSHKSVGAFLTHCGWNSVLESLVYGVPLIGWPMAAEQFFNAKFLVEEVGVCVEVARGTTFEVRHEDFMEKIELVMGDNEKAKELRNNAYRVKELIKEATRDDQDYKGSSVTSLQEFFNAAMEMKEGRW